MLQTSSSNLGLVLGAALLGILTGCVGHADGPRHARGYAPPPAYVAAEVAFQDDYVYYPRYRVYYSGNRRQFIYQDGRTWISRPVPPRVSVDVMLASPSVRLDFHDSPATHHATVVRQYPRHWKQPRPNGHHADQNRHDGRDHDGGGRR